jgi:hypothetical protein
MGNCSPNWFKRTLLERTLVASLTLIGLPSLVSAQTALKFNVGWKVDGKKSRTACRRSA